MALGQHNWLFIGSHHAAGNYAVLLTLVRSCMMLGIDPTAYLADVLVRVQRRGSSKALDDLLPAQWKKAHAFTVLKRGAAAA
jgi:transposase